MAAGDLFWLPGLQERPLRAHRGSRGGDGLRAGGAAARQGGRRRLRLRCAAPLRGRHVDRQAWRIPGSRFPTGSGGDQRTHRPAHRPGGDLPLDGFSRLASGPARAGRQPLFRRIPGWLGQGAWN